MDIQIPNEVYVKFYEWLKIKFLNIIPEPLRKKVQDTDINFWRQEIPNTNQDTYFMQEFGKVTSAPKHFYNKYLEALKNDMGSQTERDAVLVHVFKSYLRSPYPEEIIEPDTLDPHLKAKVLLQVFLERYKASLLIKYPALYVFDRISEDFCEQKTANVEASLVHTELEEVQTIKELVKLYFDSVASKNFEKMIELWSQSVLMKRWYSPIDYFQHQLKYTVTIENPIFFRLELQKNVRHAGLYVFYLEKKLIPYTPELMQLEDIKINDLSKASNLVSKILSYTGEVNALWVKEARLNEFSVEMLFESLRNDPVFSDYLLQFPNGQQAKSYYRLQRINLFKSGKGWEIISIDPVKIN